eukprot:s29_g64.t1
MVVVVVVVVVVLVVVVVVLVLVLVVVVVVAIEESSHNWCRYPADSAALGSATATGFPATTVASGGITRAMDDMLHGLSLLGPRIEQMAAHIEKLSKEVGDQRALLMQKAEQQDIAQLKQQLNHLGHGMAQKIDQLDRDAQEFMQSTVQKIDTLGGQLQGTAGNGRVDHLEERLTKAFQAIERKAEAAAFRRLEEQVLEIGGYVESKAEMAQLQSAEEVLKVLEQSISKMAAATDLEPLKRQLKGNQARHICRSPFAMDADADAELGVASGSPVGSATEAVRRLREAAAADAADAEAWPPYFREKQLDTLLTEMVEGLNSSQPPDPIQWMIRHLVQHRVSSCAEATVLPSDESEVKKKGKKGKKIGVNISACLRRGCRALLDIVCEEGSSWELIEDPSNTQAPIFFVWSGQGLLQRLNHPAGSEKVPRMPSSAWVNRFPGIGCICDKVNMALALRLLQKMWPEKFRFWPKSWLLPAEVDELCTWLDKHKSDTVIVKPEGGSQGDGIFLVQNASDLRLKLSAKPHFGAGFGALAQRYLPDPLLLDGLKFDLRLYVVVTSVDPLVAYLSREGLARFCTAKYEAPSTANANDAYMHLTNYSVNKKSTAFKDEDPFTVHTQASKRPLSTLMLQMAAQEEAAGRAFDEDKVFRSFEEVCAVLLQAMAPVIKVTYDRVAKESRPKPKPKAGKTKSPKKRPRGDLEEEEEEEDEDEEEIYAPNCFQILGVDVLLDSSLQPWLLEVNARPSMDISNPLRLSDAPPGTRRCVCRDMDGEEHCHVHSEVDVRVKRMVVDGALRMAAANGEPAEVPESFVKMNFDRYSPSEAQETLSAVARIFQDGRESEGNTATSNQMAMLVPTFDPAKDDLEQYTQKVELLSEIWPSNKMNELITRLILNTSGSAFQKLQLNRAKLMTGDKTGTQQLVATLGGQWGKVNLEKTYDIVEKALFKCVQKQDGSNDSFLARCDMVWSELKAKKIDLEQVHAYIVLRGSLLSSEDKKRVIIESESAATGALTIEKVSQSVRMLGTSFFNDMIGLKKARGKIYDQQALVTEDVPEEMSEGAAFTADDVGEDDFFDQLLHEDDEDAVLVADYEAAAANALQSDEDLASAFQSYSEARKRLSDRFKNRGFWPIGSGKGKAKQTGFGKGKGRGYGRGPRKSLQQRIMESTCRNCGRRGHWKAECPERQKSSAPSGASSTSAAMTSEAVSLTGEHSVLPMEFIQLPVVNETSLDVPSLQVINVVQTVSHETWERLRKRGNRGINQVNHSLRRSFLRNDAMCPKPMMMQLTPDADEAESAFFTTHGTYGILDTGATKSVIGSSHLPALIESFPTDVKRQLSRTQCDITFRFGNQGTLDSQHALVIPLKSIGLGLKVAIVPGETPLLLSNTLVRTLKASIDSAKQVLTSPFFMKPVTLKLSPRGLYMLDINDLIKSQRGQHRVTTANPAETVERVMAQGSAESVEAFRQKVLIYIEAMVTQHEETYDMAPISENAIPLTQEVIQPRAKVAPKSKAMAAPAMSIATEISEEMVEPWDPWDVMNPDAMPERVYNPQQEINEALQSRILNVENALTEILHHVRQANSGNP